MRNSTGISFRWHGPSSDELGQFEFRDLEIARGLVYLPGANLSDVHYPGPRVSLSAVQAEAAVGLRVHEAVTHPSPLVVRRHEILIAPRPGVLQVTETLTIDNPTLTTYVGQARNGQQAPVTLELSIPQDFERATFHREFFGRNFAVIDGKLATDIPWTPGQREIALTYTIRNESAHRFWERPLDLPCDELRVRVKHKRPEEVACNLGQPVTSQVGEVIFEGPASSWPSGQIIRVELGRLPVSWVQYARWIAFVTLVTVVLAAAVIVRRTAARQASPPSGSGAAPQVHSRRKHKTARYGRKAA